MPPGFTFLRAIVYTTVYNDIADIANNVKFSKLKINFYSLVKTR